MQQFDYINLTDYELKDLIKWNFTHIDTLFVLINIMQNNININKNECELLDQLDSTKIVFILNPVSSGSNFVPRSVLSKFKVINENEVVYRDDKYNIVYLNGPYHLLKQKGLTNIGLLPQYEIDVSEFTQYKDFSVCIAPKAYDEDRILKL